MTRQPVFAADTLLFYRCPPVSDSAREWRERWESKLIVLGEYSPYWVLRTGYPLIDRPRPAGVGYRRAVERSA